MKNLILILIVFPIMTFSQMKMESGIKMTPEYGSENQELQDILTLEKIDYCKYPCAKSAGCFADLINFLQLLSLLP